MPNPCRIIAEVLQSSRIVLVEFLRGSGAARRRPGGVNLFSPFRGQSAPRPPPRLNSRRLPSPGHRAPDPGFHACGTSPFRIVRGRLSRPPGSGGLGTGPPTRPPSGTPRACRSTGPRRPHPPHPCVRPPPAGLIAAAFPPRPKGLAAALPAAAPQAGPKHGTNSGPSRFLFPCGRKGEEKTRWPNFS